MTTNSGGSSPIASEIKFNLWREQTGVFQDVSAYRHGSLTFTGVEQLQQVGAIFVTKDYFRLFGLPIVQVEDLPLKKNDPIELSSSRTVMSLSSATHFGKGPSVATPK